ncbi:MAG: DUF1674 domain-containing protein [Proteobacteria bacterium]|nr:DUF1674 domain-containing protein [Pseudomonadota bacterium]
MKIEETKKCSESCVCSTAENNQKNLIAKSEKEISEKKNIEEKKLDPTHFGDWQIGCRTIDF